jgi:uncharacterized membrane protein YtjA (UPF0391 family)
MQRWALYFFIVSLVAAVLGFTEVAGPVASMAQIFFWLFFAVFVLTFVAALLTGRHRPVEWHPRSSH